MSLLTPLYVLGLAAITLPVLFHLIRRMPRGEMQFSSLMFLSPSPPRLTRRSRLENILLLVLRGSVLALLAFAFARPFLRQSVPVSSNDADQRRVAIVVDTSASMRRGDLWQQAAAVVDKVVADARPFDQVAVFTCDDALRPLIGFEDMSQIASAQRRRMINERLQAIGPTWAATHLGQGLMDAVELVNNITEAAAGNERIARRIVLVSDLQAGSRLGALSDFPWPDDVELELRQVKVSENTNAGLHRLADRQASSAPAAGELRVRVANDAGSAAEQFQLEWLGDNDRPLRKPVAAYVPAGESRVVRVRRPKDSGSRLRLSGDTHDFDNTLFLATRAEAERTVLYIGADQPDDPQGLRYYLERALADGLSRPLQLVAAESIEPDRLQSPAETPLVVVTMERSESQTRELRQYAESGGTVLFVLTAETPTAAWASMLALAPLELEEAAVDGYTMLGQIAFEHPLFAPTAGPHFNDFTQIHFWKYRRLTPAHLRGANILARFENGDAALAEWQLGKGRFFALTSGWQPSDSQLARSWKFVLLISGFVEIGGTGKSDRVYFVVNEPVTLREQQQENRNDPMEVVKPDGTKAALASDARAFVDTDQPGLYKLSTRDGTETFAVNLDPQESRTAALTPETLEQLGCRLVNSTAVAKNDEREQQLQDVTLESRQKFWQWLILAALGLLVAETWFAGRATTPALTEGVPV